MQKVYRMLALMLALIMLSSTAIAADLPDVLAAAGVKGEDLTSVFSALNKEIHRHYTQSLHDTDGHFQPGAIIMRALNSEFEQPAANPFLMADTDEEKLQYMFKSGLMQAEGSIKVHVNENDMDFEAVFDGGFDNDDCFALNGNTGYQIADGEIQKDKFYLRYNPQFPDQTALKIPYQDASPIEIDPAQAYLMRSFHVHRDFWITAINRFCRHLIDTPQLQPLLSWLLEGKDMPNDYELNADMMPEAIAALCDALATDTDFIYSLASTFLLEALGKDITGLDDSINMTIEDRANFIAGVLQAQRLGGLDFPFDLQIHDGTMIMNNPLFTSMLTFNGDRSFNWGCSAGGMSITIQGNAQSGDIFIIDDNGQLPIGNYEITESSLDAKLEIAGAPYLVKGVYEEDKYMLSIISDGMPIVHLSFHAAEGMLNIEALATVDTQTVGFTFNSKYDESGSESSMTITGLIEKPHQYALITKIEEADSGKQLTYQLSCIQPEPFILTLVEQMTDRINMQRFDPYTRQAEGTFTYAAPDAETVIYSGDYSYDLSMIVNERKHRSPAK